MSRPPPRISFDIDAIFNRENHYDDVFGTSRPTTVFHPARRENESTVFRVDPELAAKRASELAMYNAEAEEKASEAEVETPRFQRSFYQPPDPALECKESMKVSNSQLNAIIDRLSQPQCTNPSSARYRNQSTSESRAGSSSARVIHDTIVFDRLFEESTNNRSPSRARSSRRFEDADQHDIYEDETELLTRSLAGQKQAEMITNRIGDKDKITLCDLQLLFLDLGILERGEEIEKVPVIRDVLGKWKLDNGVFDAKRIRKVLLQACAGIRGKFRTFAKNRMSVTFANMKREIPRPQRAEVRRAKKLTQQTFDRLLTPRPEFAYEEEEEEVYEPMPMSETTKEILKNSKLANAPLAERDRQLRERARSRIAELTKQVDREQTRVTVPKTKMPELTDEERAKIAELRAKKQAGLSDFQPYRPTVTKYEDFLKIKESMEEEHEKPKGWDECIRRHRDGYKQYLEKKQDGLQAVIPLPKVVKHKRAKTSIKKEEPPPPPPEPEPEPEPVKKGQKGRAKTQLSKKAPTPKKTAKTVKGSAAKSPTPFAP